MSDVVADGLKLLELLDVRVFQVGPTLHYTPHKPVAEVLPAITMRAQKLLTIRLDLGVV